MPCTSSSLNFDNETQKQEETNLKHTMSPYVYEMTEPKFGLYIENHQMGILLTCDRWEKQIQTQF